MTNSETATKKKNKRKCIEATPISKKKNNNENNAKNKNRKDGLLEIDDLFSTKKQQDKETKEKEEEEERKQQEAKKRRMASSSSSSTSSSSLQAQKASAKKLKLSSDRNDIKQIKKGEWVDDGRGGIFDSEGYTGRREETQGLKVYKAHLFNKKGFGETKDCPFDCDCCFI